MALLTYLFFRSQSDLQLQNQFRQGKGSAFTLLAERYTDTLLSYAGRYAYGNTSHQPADLVNRAFQRMANRIKEGEVIENIVAYLKTTITRLHISDLRRRQLDTVQLSDLIAAQLPAANTSGEKTEQLLRIVQEELQLMRDDQRHIIIAKDFERLSFERIAEQLQQDLEKVKNIYYNAVKTLRRRADQMYDDYLTTV